MSERIAEAVKADPVVQAAVEEAGAGGGDRRSGTVTTQRGDTVATPTTTEEQDRVTYGQRRINIIWEATQSIVAISVTLTTLYVAASLAINSAGDTAAFLLLSNVFFLVLGTYFNRTNHVKTGGVGKNEAGR